MNKNNWRLPTIGELFAMCNREDDTKISGFNSSYYWSSTVSCTSSSRAWIVYFGYGGTGYNDKSNENFIRCVRDINDGLELAPSTSKEMTWDEAIEYAKNLEVKDEDITRIRLDGFYYKEIYTKKKYKVRVELEVNSIDLCEIVVEARNADEAKQKAIRKYESNPNDPEYNIWESEGREVVVDKNQTDEWEIEETDEKKSNR